MSAVAAAPAREVLGIRTVMVMGLPDDLRPLPEQYRVEPVAGWDALDAALEGAPPAVAVLADPYAEQPQDGGPAPRLRELIVKHPSIPFVAALELLPERMPDIQALLDWGVCEIADLGLESSPSGLAARLRGAHARPLKRRVEAILSRYASDHALTLVRAACEVAVDGGDAGDLARRFGVSPRTLTGWCAREGLPAPRRLQAWVRVLLAAALLEERGRSVVNAARGAGYATDHALRRAMRELAGGDPATLPREALFPAAAQRFNDELHASRERERERKRRSLRTTGRGVYAE
ncbi:MAG TPA: helix-turn-helix domain-containing protein [Longimicrobium sp.]|nr:helix-turn-helix domain-containing protein [Longimicrobium sp.]